MDKLKCPKCNQHTIDKKSWLLDRALKAQNFLCANKVKYTKEVFQKKYRRTENWIKQIDPGFYKEVKM